MKSILITVAAISLIINAFLICFILRSDDTKTLESDQDAFPFLSKRIFVEDQNDILINFVPLRETVRDYVNAATYKTGFYFEYLPTGNSIGLHEKDSFIPASLLKLPLAMAVSKKLESGEVSMGQKLKIMTKDIDSGYGILWKQGAGKEITVTSAVEYLIKYSDNTAARILYKIVGSEGLEQVFNSLDIPTERAEDELVISPKSYSSILRSLYLSSYLRRSSANHLLKLLSQTVYDDQIPLYVPKHIKISHKIGANIELNDQNSTYTDCGIVYIPKRPYVICIMVQAKKSEADRIISELSLLTYDYVSKTNQPSN